MIILDEIFPLIMLISYYQVYETVEEGSYIKMIDMVSGHGGQIRVSSTFISLNITLLDTLLSG